MGILALVLVDEFAVPHTHVCSFILPYTHTTLRLIFPFFLHLLCSFYLFVCIYVDLLCDFRFELLHTHHHHHIFAISFAFLYLAFLYLFFLLFLDLVWFGWFCGFSSVIWSGWTFVILPGSLFTPAHLPCPCHLPLCPRPTPLPATFPTTPTTLLFYPTCLSPTPLLPTITPTPAYL